MAMNEEWNNFMHRITEVGQLVRDLTSDDKEKSDAASTLANRYLEDHSNVIRDGELGVELKVKSDRTLINQKAFNELGKPSNPDTMDAEAWMAEMSRDAEKRAQDRRVRNERADTLKKQAVSAFRRKEYERALSYFNRAIDQVRDQPLLYTDRALTHLRLGNYAKVFTDCELALRLNEGSLKARLYKAKAHQQLGEPEQLVASRRELDELFPQHRDLICSFLEAEGEGGEGGK